MLSTKILSTVVWLILSIIGFLIGKYEAEDGDLGLIAWVVGLISGIAIVLIWVLI